VTILRVCLVIICLVGASCARLPAAQKSGVGVKNQPAVAIRYVAERNGDFAWENDLIAFRAYGPPLRTGIEGSGIDCWMKPAGRLVINKLYYEYFHKKLDYHKNRGDGYDNYKVGNSRGCGGTALWIGGEMFPADTFDSYRVIETTYGSGVFELVYNWNVKGKSYREVKRFSIIPGKRLFRVDSTFTEDGKPARGQAIAIGLARQEGQGTYTLNYEEGWLSCWSPIDGKGFGTGIKIINASVVDMVEKKLTGDDFADHGIAVVKADDSGKISYYAGFCWEGSGSFKEPSQWNAYLASFKGFDLKVKKEPSEDMNNPDVISRRVIYELFSRERWFAKKIGLHYAEAATVLGALDYAERMKDYGIIDAIDQRYRSYINGDDPRVIPGEEHCDSLPAGCMLLRLSKLTGNAEYLAKGLHFANLTWDKPAPEHGMTPMVRWWVDDMYMLPVIQVEAFKVTGDRKYLDRAARLIDEYCRKLQREDGLFSHGEAAKGFVYPWARGNGWASAGTAIVLGALPADHPRRQAILGHYRKMMSALLANQAPSGLWRQVIDVPASFEETSGSAMFAFGMSMGVREGWFTEPEKYREAVKRVWAALCAKINKDGKLSDVCVGTNKSTDLGYYLKRPTVTGDFHGQAPFLWLANSIAVPAGAPAAAN